MSEPIRTCAGCGRKAPKAELYRFVERAGVLVRGNGEPGRGVYTCKRLSCFERAGDEREPSTGRSGAPSRSIRS